MKEVKKTTGELVSFSGDKLCDSLVLAGVSEKNAKHICKTIENKLLPGSSTSNIFRQTLSHLVKKDLKQAALYGLKRGVDSLGPSGFIFEQYIEAVLRLDGFKTERNKMMRGKCVEHEVDILAKKGNNHYVIEAKYRNEMNIVTHINVVMYAHARMMDIQSNSRNNRSGKVHYYTWLITNTRFTKQSETYAGCHGLKLTGWNHPHKDSLQSIISRTKAFPITVIPSVTRSIREKFVHHDMVLAQDILFYTPELLLEHFDIPLDKGEKIISEVQEILK